MNTNLIQTVEVYSIKYEPDTFVVFTCSESSSQQMICNPPIFFNKKVLKLATENTGVLMKFILRLLEPKLY